MIKSKKRSNLPLNKKERQIEGAKIWVSYYRQNIEFHQNSNSVFIASRGLGKSWLTAVYVVCYAILYPGAKIVISTETKSQSQRLIREKIVNDLYYNCPNLRRELRERDIKIGSNESYVKFLNGSVITALNASQNTRGARCHVLLVDEFVQLRGGTDTLKSILEGISPWGSHLVWNIKRTINDNYGGFRELYTSKVRKTLIELVLECGENDKWHTFFFKPVKIFHYFSSIRISQHFNP